MQMVREILSVGLSLFLVLLIARLILEWTQVFARDYRPHGVMLVIFEVVYTVTDPPLKALRRIIPPLRIGQVSIDLAFTALFFLVLILLGVLGG